MSYEKELIQSMLNVCGWMTDDSDIQQFGGFIATVTPTFPESETNKCLRTDDLYVFGVN